MTKSRKSFAIIMLTAACVLIVLLLTGPALTRFASGGAVLKEPVYWHVMGKDAHMSLRIRQEKGGKQALRLDVWLPAGLGEPGSAAVSLRRDGETSEVPLQYVKGGPDPYGFEGFDKYTYESAGRFINDSGLWLLKVDVTDSADGTYSYEKEENIP
ncbi:hypothetical protein A7K91_20975 [Paenibacillus oryzae]|uniref:YtkA-like domain-containing protein n=1 Tax=Paenibacillus oryzae TaxID=1844972 RepID=A0A1A5YKQ5_9BACL|nr:hypothetical protein [Paenibacillus oryzae]OBR66202.1 hypothetical protein A7K91_20975 [Paenibacillus oryzae]